MNQLGVIVVAYGAPEALEVALTGVRGRELVVVDNSSRPDVQAVVLAAGGRYLNPGRNLGFAAAVNVGLAALGQHSLWDVLLLNPDAQVSPQVVDELHRTLEHRDHERTGVVAPLLRSPDGDYERVFWPFPAPGLAWLEALGFARLRFEREEFLVGAVLLLRAEAVATVGAFDERFFLYAEEADWQRRAAQLGWGRHLRQDLVAVHEGAGTSTSATRREALFHAGQETYVRKWFGCRGWVIYRAAVLVGCGLRAALASDEARRAARHRLRLYARGPRVAAGLKP